MDGGSTINTSLDKVLVVSSFMLSSRLIKMNGDKDKIHPLLLHLKLDSLQDKHRVCSGNYSSASPLSIWPSPAPLRPSRRPPSSASCSI